MSLEKLLQETGCMLFGMSVDMRIHADAREALAMRAEKIEEALIAHKLAQISNLRKNAN